MQLSLLTAKQRELLNTLRLEQYDALRAELTSAFIEGRYSITFHGVKFGIGERTALDEYIRSKENHE